MYNKTVKPAQKVFVDCKITGLYVQYDLQAWKKLFLKCKVTNTDVQHNCQAITEGFL